MNVTFLQTSDPFLYSEMLEQTSKTVRAFCRENGFLYESYVGIKRGYWPWQASFNRIYQLQELIERGYEGWAIYVDADAYICNQKYDLRGFLSTIVSKAFAATPSGASEQFWDINNGVFFLNVSHPTGRHIVRRWRQRYESIDDDELRRCNDFNMGFDDQAMLHEILRSLRQPALDCFRCDWDVVNSPRASFVRQQLRAMNTDFRSRLEAVTSAVRHVMSEIDQ